MGCGAGQAQLQTAPLAEPGPESPKKPSPRGRSALGPWALAFPRVAPASAPCAGQNTQEQLEGPRVCPYGDRAGCPHLHGFIRKHQRRCSFRWMNGTFSGLRS